MRGQKESGTGNIPVMRLTSKGGNWGSQRVEYMKTVES